VYNAKTEAAVAALSDDSTLCIKAPYNIEAAVTCGRVRKPPVQMKLLRSNCATLKRQKELDAPYLLWGNSGRNVLPNTRPLPDGSYYLDSKIDGVTHRVKFTQCCGSGCPDPTFDYCRLEN
jgi:hypothetical protein